MCGSCLVPLFATAFSTTGNITAAGVAASVLIATPLPTQRQVGGHLHLPLHPTESKTFLLTGSINFRDLNRSRWEEMLRRSTERQQHRCADLRVLVFLRRGARFLPRTIVTVPFKRSPTELRKKRGSPSKFRTRPAEGFERMSGEELDAYARDGKLPAWFPRQMSSASAGDS